MVVVLAEKVTLKVFDARNRMKGGLRRRVGHREKPPAYVLTLACADHEQTRER